MLNVVLQSVVAPQKMLVSDKLFNLQASETYSQI